MTSYAKLHSDMVTQGVLPLHAALAEFDTAKFNQAVSEKLKKLTDPVHRPTHYTRFKIEPIYFIMENNLPFWAGNVIKYTCRHDAKNGIEDLKKARRYLDMQIKKMEGDARFAE